MRNVLNQSATNWLLKSDQQPLHLSHPSNHKLDSIQKKVIVAGHFSLISWSMLFHCYCSISPTDRTWFLKNSELRSNQTYLLRIHDNTDHSKFLKSKSSLYMIIRFKWAFKNWSSVLYIQCIFLGLQLSIRIVFYDIALYFRSRKREIIMIMIKLLIK